MSKKSKIDYSELAWKMDKYMPDDSESQDEYYETLDDGDVDALIDYFEVTIQDDERFDSYMPKGGTLKGFCKYLMSNLGK